MKSRSAHAQRKETGKEVGKGSLLSPRSLLEPGSEVGKGSRLSPRSLLELGSEVGIRSLLSPRSLLEPRVVTNNTRKEVPLPSLVAGWKEEKRKRGSEQTMDVVER